MGRIWSLIQCASKGEGRQRWLTDFWIEQVVQWRCIHWDKERRRRCLFVFSCARKILCSFGGWLHIMNVLKTSSSFINWLEFQEREIYKIYGFVGIINIYIITEDRNSSAPLQGFLCKNICWYFKTRKQQTKNLLTIFHPK